MSKVANLRKQIELECAAMALAMGGFRASASHDIINNKYNTLGELQEQLAGEIGETASMVEVVNIYGRILV